MGFLKRLFGEDDRPQPPTAKVWTEAEYGALLERVLAGVAQGWDRSRVLAELGDRVDDVRFYQTWLAEKFGLELLKATTRDEERVRRLEQLRNVHQVDNIGLQINIHVLKYLVIIRLQA